jgi:hypothetical protein
MQGKCNTSQNKYLVEHQANDIITLATLTSVLQTKVFLHLFVYRWDSLLKVHYCRIEEARDQNILHIDAVQVSG